MTLYLTQDSIQTPLGTLRAVISERGLFILTFEEESAFIVSRSRLYYPQFVIKPGAFPEILQQTQEWITHYFSSKPEEPEATRLPLLDLQGSSFAKAIWTSLMQIPENRTASYGELAQKAGFSKAARAVGRVVGLNPIALMIPCHRILGKDGTLTGYRSGLDRKRWLLEHEKNKSKK